MDGLKAWLEFLLEQNFQISNPSFAVKIYVN